MKDFDTMQLLWQQDTGTNRFSIDAESMHKELLRQGKQFNKQIRFRDNLEGILGLVIALFFAATPFLPNTEGPWVDHWEWFVLSAGCLFVAITFAIQRRRAKQWEIHADHSILETLKNSRDHLNHQIKLLRNILWWYCLPIEIPLLLVTFTSPMFEGFRVSYSLITLAFMVGVVAYNWWHVRRNLIPKRDSLLQLLQDTEEEPLDASATKP